jgi:hypothetical protein
VHLYTISVFAWAIVHLVFGDSWAWLFLISAFAPYMFVLLPAVLLIAVITRRREICFEVLAILGLAAFLYGTLFLPKALSSGLD